MDDFKNTENKTNQIILQPLARFCLSLRSPEIQESASGAASEGRECRAADRTVCIAFKSKTVTLNIPVNLLQGVSQLLSNVKCCIRCQKTTVTRVNKRFLIWLLLRLILLRSHSVALKAGMILFSATFLFAHASAHI